MSTPISLAGELHKKTWMKDMAVLDNRPLREIVIPGSHDAGTFVMDTSLANNSSKCQDLDIYGQLAAGSRYLDLRAWKAKDGAFWMYHGSDWTHVKLEAVLADINRFLDECTGEIVVATLLVDEGPGAEGGWRWACSQVQKHLLTDEALPEKGFAEATPADLRRVGKRLVMLRSSSPAQLACMDREGVYGNSLSPEVYLKKLEEYRSWSDKMWVLHLGIPYSGDINTMLTRSGWNADAFIPLFKGTKTPNLLHRQLNIINVDFVDKLGWVEAIVGLNHYPKQPDHVIAAQTAHQTFTWTLRAMNQGGKLWVGWETNCPFRAQMGRIHIYKSHTGFPESADADVEAFRWDNEAKLWNTNLNWSSDMHIAWVAEQSPNGARVPLVSVVTHRSEVMARKSYTWTVRAGNVDDKLLVEADTNSPFRAQQGQLKAFAPNTNAEEAWAWDNNSRPWHTGLKWASGRTVTWVAHKPPEGPYVPFLSLKLT